MKILKNRYNKKILEIKNNKKKLDEIIKDKKPLYKFLNYIIFIFLCTFKFIPEIIIISIICICTVYLSVSLYSRKYIYSSIEDIPYNDVALVLGTSKYLYNGQINMYFKFRMEAAYELYKSGKVKFILVSGDNRYRSYNEPRQMRLDLIKLGVDKKHIFLDFAGFRTRDSIIRANKVFELTNFTIVSQPFHNERAILIARQKKINAIAYNANNVRKLYRVRQFPRELGARILMFIDIIFNKPPKFYGDIIKIEEREDIPADKSNKIDKKLKTGGHK
ncbi:ElyC/SanA/YdcF family protein [uncultured Brachyspira sp.]|uniref:SanA/YdcF family protein n=1 Tax=uncultured Brachyspira sp. TaxID=221953 RepID=UPI00261B032A|nr:ElyC/SanA/YdcF family protein [uncultured Brachyspira sp.]